MRTCGSTTSGCCSQLRRVSVRSSCSTRRAGIQAASRPLATSTRATGSSTLGIYSRADAHSGRFRSLVRFVAPARDAGKLMLYSGKDLWFYDPANKASVRLSPQQRLLGQASNGDVVSVNLALDYRASDAGEEDVPDGERGTRHCHKLTLAARTPEASYHHIEIWIDTGTLQPGARQARQIRAPVRAIRLGREERGPGRIASRASSPLG